MCGMVVVVGDVVVNIRAEEWWKVGHWVAWMY